MRPRGAVPSLLLPLLLAPAAQRSAACAGPPRWEPRFLGEYPLALCNDGSPAAYYFRPGADRSRQWLVFLEGGMWCWDRHSCAPGLHGVFSSKFFPRTNKAVAQWASKLHGLFDQDSPLAQANIAFVRSCSNDGFMGDASLAAGRAARELGKPGPWHFRGRRIIDSVFADLRTRTGLGDTSRDMLVFGGCSAGARGAIASLDYVASSLAGRARTVGLFDSPLWVPIPPLNPGVVSFTNQTSAAITLFNSSFISEECGSAYPGAERWKCLFPAFRLPFVHTPYLLSHSQYDKFAINWNVRRFLWMPKSKLNHTVLEFAEQYRSQVVSHLPTPVGPGKAIFSSACYFHCTTMFSFVHWIRVQGLTLLELLQRWLVDPGEGRLLRDDCRGFDCGSPGGFLRLAPAVLQI
mmetsp:Transcript_78084/g.220809  ORF Transcript_78084/g.220809 Transcript_78084/m.220809 type:complete len:406 (+) Transcript_78084:66-1283(+)